MSAEAQQRAAKAHAAAAEGKRLRGRKPKDPHAARGLPRQIGNLAVSALIAGYARRNTIIDMDCATAAIADATSE